MRNRRSPSAAAVLVAFAVTASVFVAAPAGAWGFRAHIIITRAAIDALPPGLQPFFKAHVDFITAHSVDPDKWRWEDLDWETVCAPERGRPALEGYERPRHFLDADAIAPYPFREIQRDFGSYRRSFPDEWSGWGSAPWTVEAYTELLREEMAAEKPDLEALLCRSSILAHYVADLSQPLHLTVNYDGQLSGLEGVHARIERHLVDYYDEVLVAKVVAAAPQAMILGDPTEAAFEMIVDGYPGVYALLRADLRAQRAVPIAPDRRAEENPAYMRELWRGSGDLVAERMAYGAEKVASFWTTAWDSAGRPDLLQTATGRNSLYER